MPPLASPAPQMEAFKSRDLSVQLPPSADCHSSQQERDNPPPPPPLTAKMASESEALLFLSSWRRRPPDRRTSAPPGARRPSPQTRGTRRERFSRVLFLRRASKTKLRPLQPHRFRSFLRRLTATNRQKDFVSPGGRGGGNLSSRWQSRWLWLEPPGHEGSF